MPFEFPLQPVLRLRESLEERERLRLGLIIAHINQQRVFVTKLESAQRLTAEQLATDLKRGITGGELHVSRGALAAFDRHKKAVLQKIAELEAQKRRQEQAFREAQINRKTLESLRDRRLAAYQIEQARREQQRVDDLFSLRRHAAEPQA